MMIFRREVIGQFYCKLLLSSDIAKAKIIVVEPVKQEKSEFTVIWFKLISDRDFETEKLLDLKCTIATWIISLTGK